MSVCSPCFDSGISVAACNAGIAFGVVPAGANYVVRITHNATKKVQQFNAESDEDGIITIENAKIDAMQGYTITLQGCEKFTICEVEYDCIAFKVANIDIEEPEVINLLECLEC